ncbi:hypothetical protein DLAC_06978 [Tieghemostelium lacteum]|uniref:Transmembrane protein n=1 Tax=Tieghemostelium lacteum TaxID=361077 RepID=A0A151ZDW8_TIELA|nr:hypothetical protein DLAC_06978 [Tieghemostelium lacteum]|eukprot:KYQ92137.1 hypothetical protein DLAC_06978 [Tieghemostelium lacteum]
MKVIEFTDDQLDQMEEQLNLQNEMLLNKVAQKLQIQVIVGLCIVLVVLSLASCVAWLIYRPLISEYYNTKYQQSPTPTVHTPTSFGTPTRKIIFTPIKSR